MTTNPSLPLWQRGAAALYLGARALRDQMHSYPAHAGGVASEVIMLQRKAAEVSRSVRRRLGVEL